MTEINKQIERTILKIAEKYKVEMDLIDYKSIWDTKLNTEENIFNIRNYIEELSGSEDFNNKIEGDLKTKKNSLKNEKEQLQKTQLENFKREEEQTRKIFNKEIDNILKEDNPNIEQYFKNVKHYIKMVANNFNNGLILKSVGGLGKTYLILKTLKEEKINFEYINGYSTNLSFYEFLYHNKDKDVIVFDDFSGVLNNNIGISILKSALWSTTGKRVLNYLTTSDKISVPSQFVLNARVIFCLNDELGKDDDSLALKSRALFYEVKFNYKEIIKIMFEIAKQKYKNSTKEERLKVVEYLKSITDETSKEINFRTLIKCFDIFLYCKKEGIKWKSLVKDLIETDEDLKIIKEIIEDEPIIKEQLNKFCEITGKSRATFFRYKKRLIKSAT